MPNSTYLAEEHIEIAKAKHREAKKRRRHRKAKQKALKRQRLAAIPAER